MAAGLTKQLMNDFSRLLYRYKNRHTTSTLCLTFAQRIPPITHNVSKRKSSSLGGDTKAPFEPAFTKFKSTYPPDNKLNGSFASHSSLLRTLRYSSVVQAYDVMIDTAMLGSRDGAKQYRANRVVDKLVNPETLEKMM